MEFTDSAGKIVNGVNEVVELELDYLYPMMKSSDLTSGRPKLRKMLVPQLYPAADVTQIERVAPKTWHYLRKHADILRNRGSSIYRNKSEFSIFGVGPYSFTPWKVAISGFYKKLTFTVVGPREGRPVVFDDTVYFLACYSQAEASFLAGLLQSKGVQSLLESVIHWEAKRPITVDLLSQVDLRLVADELGVRSEYDLYVEAADKPLAALKSFGLFKAG